VKDDRVYLEHIRDALDDIAMYASAGRAVFFADGCREGSSAAHERHSRSSGEHLNRI